MMVRTKSTKKVCVVSCVKSCVIKARSGSAPCISGFRLREGLFPNTKDNVPKV